MSVTVAGLGGNAMDLEAGDLRAAEHLHRRQVSEEQWRKFEGTRPRSSRRLGLI
jgi:hypothetical protein